MLSLRLLLVYLFYLVLFSLSFCFSQLREAQAAQEVLESEYLEAQKELSSAGEAMKESVSLASALSVFSFLQPTHNRITYSHLYFNDNGNGTQAGS